MTYVDDRSGPYMASYAVLLLRRMLGEGWQVKPHDATVSVMGKENLSRCVAVLARLDVGKLTITAHVVQVPPKEFKMSDLESATKHEFQTHEQLAAFVRKHEKTDYADA